MGAYASIVVSRECNFHTEILFPPKWCPPLAPPVPRLGTGRIGMGRGRLPVILPHPNSWMPQWRGQSAKREPPPRA